MITPQPEPTVYDRAIDWLTAHSAWMDTILFWAALLALAGASIWAASRPTVDPVLDLLGM